MLSGASVRYRFYTRWGVTAEELSRIVFSYSVTFWLGLLALGGLSLATESAARRIRDCQPNDCWSPGRLAAHAAPASATCSRQSSGGRRCDFGRFELPLPSPRIAVAQLLLSAVDWALAGAVLYVLLPAEHAVVSPVPRDLSRRDPARAWPATFPAASACSRG